VIDIVVKLVSSQFYNYITHTPRMETGQGIRKRVVGEGISQAGR
jgi:hypothetical protein